MVGSTLVVYLARAGHISTVAVRPAYRRRGFAQAILARAQEEIRRSGRGYAGLEVLSENAPAIALYRRLGYELLGTSTLLARDPAPGERLTFPTGSRLRSFERRDAEPLADVANGQLPPNHRAVFPVTPGAFTVPPLIANSTKSISAAWVLEGPTGAPNGFLRATVGGLTRSGHLTAPILGPQTTSEEGLDLVRTGLAWIGAQRAGLRTVVQANEGMTLARQSLATAGFTPQVSLETLVLRLAA